MKDYFNSDLKISSIKMQRQKVPISRRSFSTISNKHRKAVSCLNTSMMLPNRKYTFGIAEYKTPIPVVEKSSIKLGKISPSKRKDFFDAYVKEKDYLPAPDKYDTNQNKWLRKNREMIWSNTPRLTISEQAIKESPRTPGPGAYSPKPSTKPVRSETRTTKRELGFINEAKVRGENTPHATLAKLDMVKPRVRSIDFKKYAKPRETKIIKNKGAT